MSNFRQFGKNHYPVDSATHLTYNWPLMSKILCIAEIIFFNDYQQWLADCRRLMKTRLKLSVLILQSILWDLHDKDLAAMLEENKLQVQ